MKNILNKIFIVLFLLLTSLQLTSCSRKEIDANVAFTDYIEKIDFDVVKEKKYIEVSVITEENTEEMEVLKTETKTMLFQPGKFYICVECNGEKLETLYKEEADACYKYIRQNGSGITSEQLTLEEYTYIKNELLDSVMTKEYLPSSVDEIVSVKTLISGITSLDIVFERGDCTFNILVSDSCILKSVTRLNSITNETVTIKFEYKYGFNYTDIPTMI